MNVWQTCAHRRKAFAGAPGVRRAAQSAAALVEQTCSRTLRTEAERQARICSRARTRLPSARKCHCNNRLSVRQAALENVLTLAVVSAGCGCFPLYLLHQRCRLNRRSTVTCATALLHQEVPEMNAEKLRMQYLCQLRSC